MGHKGCCRRAYRFLQRVWRLVVDEHTSEIGWLTAWNSTSIRREFAAPSSACPEDFAALRNNTATAK